MVRAITVRVVSAPPSSSSRQSLTTSCGERARPSTSAVVQTVMTSSAGQRFLDSYRPNAAIPNSSAAAVPSGVKYRGPPPS